MENKNQSTEKTNVEFYVQIGIIALLTLVIVFSFGKIYGGSGAEINGATTESVSTSDIIPTGVPAVYGQALGVSYDDVSASNPKLAEALMQKFSAYEDEELNSAQMVRYIKIAGSISCEYCCGADAIIFSNGEAACGCAHSYAMRGLAKYLLINNPEMSDYEILSELGKWKVLFYPGVHEQKAKVLEANGIDSTDYVNLASNLYRGIENQAVASSSGSGSQMVGGC